MDVLPRGESSNHTVDALQVFCGYPLSGPYQLMPRVILYLLVWWAFWARTALVVVMIWTSVAAVHVITLAGSHSYAALDLDMFPAYSQVLLGLLFAPAYVAFSKGLKEARRIDVLGACVWMVLLWTATATYVSTTRFQPTALPCVDSQSHNISSHALLSHCTFQCGNITTAHAMRNGQSATLVAVPSFAWTGRGKTDHVVVFWTVMMLCLILHAFWIASKKSLVEYTREQVKRSKTKKAKESHAKTLILTPKIAFVSYVIIVWFAEDAMKHMPPHEKRTGIGQWGPLAAFAFACIGTLLRCFAPLAFPDIASGSRANITKDQKGAATNSEEPQDVEMGMTPPPYALQQPVPAHLVSENR